MAVKNLCDRCGKVTINKGFNLLYKDNKAYGDDCRFIDNDRFMKLLLCKDCMDEFLTDFRYNHLKYNDHLTEETKKK